MLDLIIKGGTVVAPAGAGLMDVGIQGEQIAAVASPGALDDIARPRTTTLLEYRIPAASSLTPTSMFPCPTIGPEATPASTPSRRRQPAEPLHLAA